MMETMQDLNLRNLSNTKDQGKRLRKSLNLIFRKKEGRNKEKDKGIDREIETILEGRIEIKLRVKRKIEKEKGIEIETDKEKDKEPRKKETQIPIVKAILKRKRIKNIKVCFNIFRGWTRKQKKC